MIRDRYPYEKALTICISVAAVSICIIGTLFFVDLSPRIERLIYYGAFAALATAGIAYNLVSANKGMWIYRKLAKKRDGSP